MRSSVAVQEQQSISRWDEQEMVQTLKQTVCKGATDAQFRMFVEICKVTGLNPLLKEIWFVPGVGIIAARDGYLRVANEHPQFDGIETRVERDEKKVPIKAVCTVWRKDRQHPTICEAYFSEYKKGSGVWSMYPSAMISKVAEVLALKRSFSINGVVSEEEMGPTAANPVEAGSVEVLPSLPMLNAPQEVEQEVIPCEVPDRLQAMYDTLTGKDKFAKLDVFSGLKADLHKLLDDNDTKYYEILNHYGVDKSSEFKSAKPAQCAARDMWLAVQKALKAVEKKDGPPFVATDDDVPSLLQTQLQQSLDALPNRKYPD